MVHLIAINLLMQLRRMSIDSVHIGGDVQVHVLFAVS